MSPDERMAALVAAIAEAGGPHDRLQAIAERRSPVAEVAPDARNDALLVRGCQARVWLDGVVVDGRLHLAASAEGPLVAGLVRLVCEIADGAAPAELAACDLDPLAPLGLDRRLSPTRLRGLAALRARIRALAGDG